MLHIIHIEVENIISYIKETETKIGLHNNFNKLQFFHSKSQQKFHTIFHFYNPPLSFLTKRKLRFVDPIIRGFKVSL